MVIMGKRSQTEESPVSTKKMNTTITVENSYEQSREQRIRENKERLQKLGIHDLSIKLKSELLPPKRSPRYTPERRTPKYSSPVPSSEPRRSSRLQSVTPVSYTEPRLKKGRLDGEEDRKELIREGDRPEIYTDEHEKKLGSCNTPWTLYVDGIGTDGKRIYDPVKGKTCHQCRQKTLGHRTHCSICNMVQGQFCGDCLYTRYGENVLEANQNPNWICPVCRGICNCSLCRLAKGWVPTGYMYRKVEKLGYKSVAHYLIQTRRGETISEEKENTKNTVSAKRSLPFNDAEDSTKQTESLDSTEIGEALAGSTEESLCSHENLKQLSEDSRGDADHMEEKKAENVGGTTEELSQQKEAPNSHENSKQLSVDNKDADDHMEEKKAEPENVGGSTEELPQQKEILNSRENSKQLSGDNKDTNDRMEEVKAEPESVGGSTEELPQQKEILSSRENLKQLSAHSKDTDDHMEEKNAETENVGGTPEVKTISPKTTPKIRKSPRTTTPNLNTIAGRLRQRRTIS